MREIKFRAWDKEKKQIISWEYIPVFEDNSTYLVDYFDFKYTPYELMQFTGLKDKNGKEIYEGDIVKNNNENWEIYYDEGAYRLRQVGKNGNFLLLGEPQHSEIIGNIYENPELLQTKDKPNE